MAKKEKSFFDDKRFAFSDPNFINRDDFYVDLVKPNAYKRIVRDLAHNTISQSDYVYFTHNRFITTLQQVATIEYNNNRVIGNSLMYYVTDILPTNRILQSETPINAAYDRAIAQSVREIAESRAFVWYEFLTAVQYITSLVMTPEQAFENFRIALGKNPLVSNNKYLDI